MDGYLSCCEVQRHRRTLRVGRRRHLDIDLYSCIYIKGTYTCRAAKGSPELDVHVKNDGIERAVDS